MGLLDWFRADAPEGMVEFPPGSGNYIKKSNLKPGESIDPSVPDFVPAAEFDLVDSVRRNVGKTGGGIIDGVKWLVTAAGVILTLLVIVQLTRRR